MVLRVLFTLTAVFVLTAAETRVNAATPSFIASTAEFLGLREANGRHLALTAVTHTVINTNDSGPGSLRQAVLDANNTAADDMIDFNIPIATDPGCVPATGVCTIMVSSHFSIENNGSLTISGPGANHLILDGGTDPTVFSPRIVELPSFYPDYH